MPMHIVIIAPNAFDKVNTVCSLSGNYVLVQANVYLISSKAGETLFVRGDEFKAHWWPWDDFSVIFQEDRVDANVIQAIELT